MAGYERTSVPGRPDVEAITVANPAEVAQYIYDMCRRPLMARANEQCRTDDGKVVRMPDGEPDLLMPVGCVWERTNRCRIAAGQLLLELSEAPAAEAGYHRPPVTVPLLGAEQRAAMQPRPPIHPGELEPGGPPL